MAIDKDELASKPKAAVDQAGDKAKEIGAEAQKKAGGLFGKAESKLENLTHKDLNGDGTVGEESEDK